MARIRALKIGFFKNEALTEFSPWHRLLFAGLWLLADKSGRLEYRPKRIKAELFPYDRVNVEEMVSDLTAGDDPFLVRYQVDGRELLAIQNFSKHQRPHHTEPDSEYPGPNKKNTVRQPLDNGEEPDEHRSSTPGVGVGVGVSNGVGVEEGNGEGERALTHATPEALRDLWNEMTAFPIQRVKELTDTRKRLARQRLRERPDLQVWATAIGKIQSSPFCRGEKGGTWRASFDWLLKPDTVVRVIEDKYEDYEQQNVFTGRRTAAQTTIETARRG